MVDQRLAAPNVHETLKESVLSIISTCEVQLYVTQSSSPRMGSQGLRLTASVVYAPCGRRSSRRHEIFGSKFSSKRDVSIKINSPNGNHNVQGYRLRSSPQILLGVKML